MGNTIANAKDSMLKFDTSYTEGQAARRGKHSITGESIETEDIPHSEVAADWESRNNKAITSGRPKAGINFDIAADFDLLGKVVGDLQKNVGVSADNIVGTLKYVEDYTGFSGDPAEQQGNYIAFKVGYDGDYTNITIQKGDKDEANYDPNDFTFILIMDKHYPITVRAYNGDTVVASKTYNTDQLVFEPAENS